MLCPFKDLTPLGHYTDRGPMDIGQYNGLSQYCGSHTASSMFLITSLIIVDDNYKGSCYSNFVVFLIFLYCNQQQLIHIYHCHK